jgi:hypothetical protein
MDGAVLVAHLSSQAYGVTYQLAFDSVEVEENLRC